MSRKILEALKLRTYPEYKSISHPAIEKIPSHWDSRRIRYVFRERGEVSKAGTEELLSLSKYTGVKIRSTITDKEPRAESLVGYKKCKPNDIVSNIMLAWDSAIGVAFNSGIVSPAYEVYVPQQEIDPYFLDSLLRSLEYKVAFTIASKGILPSRWRMYTESFNDIQMILPPLNEQKQIGTFVHRIDQKVSDIAKKFKLQISLLEETRASHIHNALDYDETIQMRLGHAVEQMFRPIERIQTETYHPLGLYNRGRGIFNKPPTLGSELGDSKFFYVKPNDLILSGQFAWEGAVALASEQHSNCVVSHRYPVLRGKPELLDSAYLQSFFNTKHGDFILNQHSRGAAGRNRPLNIVSLLKEKIPIPPIDAQLEISNLVYIERKMRDAFAKYSTRINEYRATLISAAVTGKIDLRGHNDG